MFLETSRLLLQDRKGSVTATLLDSLVLYEKKTQYKQKAPSYFFEYVSHLNLSIQDNWNSQSRFDKKASLKLPEIIQPKCDHSMIGLK